MSESTGLFEDKSDEIGNNACHIANVVSGIVLKN
jgi:hypothetical protein